MPRMYKFDDAQISEIEKTIRNCKEKNIYRRLQCLKLRAVDKKDLAEISKIVSYNLKYVSQIISKYCNHGMLAITKKNYQGNRRKLTKEQERELLEPFITEAEKGTMVVVDDIRKAYEEKTGEKSAPATIYYLLARNGWRKIMPRSKHPKKASDEDIDAYKKNHR